MEVSWERLPERYVRTKRLSVLKEKLPATSSMPWWYGGIAFRKNKKESLRFFRLPIHRVYYAYAQGAQCSDGLYLLSALLGLIPQGQSHPPLPSRRHCPWRD